VSNNLLAEIRSFKGLFRVERELLLFTMVSRYNTALYRKQDQTRLKIASVLTRRCRSFEINIFKIFLKNWIRKMPGKAAGQGCRARLPGKAAEQGCRARLPGKADVMVQ
jgi:hypothetical protein